MISQMHRSTKVKRHPSLPSRSALHRQITQATVQSSSTLSERDITRPIRRLPADLRRIHLISGSKTLAWPTLWQQVQTYRTTSMRLIKELRPSHWATQRVYQLQLAPWLRYAKFFLNRNDSGRVAQHRRNITSFTAPSQVLQVYL